jgi:hypothetical protein
MINVFLYNDAGVQKVGFQNHNGGYVNAMVPVSVNTNYFIIGRHDGTNIYMSLNGGAETSVPSGPTSSITGPMHLGGQNGSYLYNGRMGEIATWNVALSGADLVQAITHFNR